MTDSRVLVLMLQACGRQSVMPAWSMLRLVQADALIAMVDAKMRAPSQVSLGPDGLQRLFAAVAFLLVTMSGRHWCRTGDDYVVRRSEFRGLPGLPLISSNLLAQEAVRPPKPDGGCVARGQLCALLLPYEKA